ncbi:glycosyltransferase [Pseudactinotalea suaedae]|uniref:glycosyltransferase n=1 Tax=Pseudactinotalea suaedae TaxID=1524924 RepID=UPI0012E19EDD|nr:glycosyltransferase [Pseudactinotalea suaedae]
MTTGRLVIVVRADPVICGHSGEARNLAEAALLRGFDDVRIVTWPIERLQESGLPLKPLDEISPYSEGIVVERPEPVGDYKVPDGRYLAGIVGRLVELFTDGVPTLCLSLYLSPHTVAVSEALRIAEGTGLPVNVRTIAEAVGSDITNVVRSAVAEGRFGAAAQVLSAYLSSDVCAAVSQYTKTMIVESAAELDLLHGTGYARRCRERVRVSYPAIDTAAYTSLSVARRDSALARRGLRAGGYVLFLSRLGRAKGVEDLIDGYGRSQTRHRIPLVICGNGPERDELHAWAERTGAADRIMFLHDVSDAEKPALMAGSLAYVLPSKPRPEFTETFGIALVEQMLAGGGPVITCDTGGIREAVGDAAIFVPPSDPGAIAAALDRVVIGMDAPERAAWSARARQHALQFDRMSIFDNLLVQVDAVTPLRAAS